MRRYPGFWPLPVMRFLITIVDWKPGRRGLLHYTWTTLFPKESRGLSSTAISATSGLKRVSTTADGPSKMICYLLLRLPLPFFFSSP
ncbi:hypothetical protein NPIL_19651 [Nephila pilipes]|uniref:Uncharacterized protein n=1 Tax=Nephila pilipes TaxID=299642 RepID=A0A8X6U3S1_NEPPI|nr:hypothetical protein NPIL_19651 [Nephila pilipes]